MKKQITITEKDGNILYESEGFSYQEAIGILRFHEQRMVKEMVLKSEQAQCKVNQDTLQSPIKS